MVWLTMLIFLEPLFTLWKFPSRYDTIKKIFVGAENVKEAFYDLFTDDPVNWLKWVIVLIVLVLGYVISIPLYKKVSYRLSWERKRDLARSRKHIIKATLVKKYPSGEAANYDWHATYRYSFNGEEKQYKAFFTHPSTPPIILYLYYLKNPKRLFSCEEYHYQNHKAIILLPIIVLPWVLAMLFIVILKIELPN